MGFKICVALQITSGDLKENNNLIQKALETKPDLIELRLDYLDDIEFLDETFVQALLDFISPEVAVITTFRASSEGGQMKIEESNRIDLIKMLIKCKPQYIDIEAETDISVLNDIFELAKQQEIKLIFSIHDFKKTPTYEEAIKQYEDLISVKKVIQEGIYKVIFSAENFEDNFVSIKVCKEISKRKQEIICFCMGEEGIFSRISCVNFGASFTYASIAESTAPGQIHINKLREVMNLIFNKG